MDIQKVTVAGSGVLGTQIAFQAAFHGYDVTMYDVSGEAIEKAKGTVKKLGHAFKEDLDATQQQVDEAAAGMAYSLDLKEAVKDADLLIEAVPENAEIKTKFYKKLAKAAPSKTIFATNTSTLLPSQFAEATGRPAKFLALHFANEIWKNNTAEVMGHAETDPDIFDRIIEFAESIGMVPIPVHKEQPGYILNSLLVPFLTAATNLFVKDVADVESVDKTWMIATGAPIGPFGTLDVIGINTVYNVNKTAAEKTGDPLRAKAAQYLKENFIDKNRLGVSTGQGFYSYPNPAYKEPDFLE
jgi:3-hydroxybutyryl-CoA dehydrogenase